MSANDSKMSLSTPKLCFDFSAMTPILAVNTSAKDFSEAKTYDWSAKSSGMNLPRVLIAEASSERKQ